MSESGHCADCQRPIRSVRVQWETGPKDFRIPLDYVKSLDGDYAVVGPESAVFIKFEERATFNGPLYTDHRRTCPMKKSDVDPDRPSLTNLKMECEGCSAKKFFYTTAELARDGALEFIEEHVNCRGRKAS